MPTIIDDENIAHLDKQNSDKHAENNAELRQCVQKALDDYLKDLGDYKPDNLYSLFISEVEAPLLEAILTYTRGNQSTAAQMLGINRGTLRKKITQYAIKSKV